MKTNNLWKEWEALQTGTPEPFAMLKHDGIVWRFHTAKSLANFKEATKNVPIGDRTALGTATKQKITDKTKSAWYPKKEHRERRDWYTPSPVTTKYPVYVISKGRWQHSLRLTSRALEDMQVPYFLVVEPQEKEQYKEALEKDEAKFYTLLTLPCENYNRSIEGQGGGIPVRNWVWNRSVAHRDKRHWILDDNLFCFQRLYANEKQKVWSGAVLRMMEDYVDLFSNVALAGPNYIFFAPADSKQPPYRLNTRVYSCILVNNELNLGERWRGRYNEDTDLSIRALKAGWCTMLFSALLVDKTTTMRNTGGNTTSIYTGSTKTAESMSDTKGREAMADSLVAQHPDVVVKVRKFKRWHHSVDYSGFKANELKRSDVTWPKKLDDYGLYQK
jgi:hypothetical protein